MPRQAYVVSQGEFLYQEVLMTRSATAYKTMTDRLRHGLIALLAAAMICAPTLLPSGPARAAPNPEAVVAQLNGILLEVMRNAESLGYQGRYDKLAPVLEASFNLPLMARATVGRYWRDLDEAQREELVQLFTRLSIATFAARFDGYDGESFEILGERPALRGTVLVENELRRTDGEPPVGLNYLVKEFDGNWQAVDVFLDARFSEVAVKRSEYTSVIKNQGFDKLLETLDRKISELASGS